MPATKINPLGRVPKRYYNAALKQVNKIRVENHKRPIKRLPKGVIGSASRCPIGAGLSSVFDLVSVGPTSIIADRRDGERVFVSLTLGSQEFIKRFDAALLAP